MSTVAIIGAGPLGGALAHALAGRSRVGEVRLIDPEGRIAEGKALDILQSSPVEQFSTRVTAAPRATPPPRAPTSSSSPTWCPGERLPARPGWRSLRQLARMEATAPFLFAGGLQRELMERAMAELHLAPRAAAGIGAAGARVGRPRRDRRADRRQPGRPLDRRGRRAAARRGDRLGRGDGVPSPDRATCSRRTTCRR